MNILLWILQGILAAMFLMAGFMKASKSKDELVKNGGARMSWTADVSANNLKVIGVLEVLAALGLILPQLTGILPWLTSLSAAGLVLMMIGAMILHLRRGDGTQSLMTNLFLLLMAGFVAYGRFLM